MLHNVVRSGENIKSLIAPSELLDFTAMSIDIIPVMSRQSMLTPGILSQISQL